MSGNGSGRSTVAAACACLACASCGASLGEIRSAAESGDVRTAIRLAAGELDGLRAAASGTLGRFAASRASAAAALAALDQAPATAKPLLEDWAEDDSAVGEETRTFARARLSELEGGAFEDELLEALGSPAGRVRAYALRGLLASGVAVPALLAALDDEDPAVCREAARGLAGVAAQDGGIAPDYSPALLDAFAGHPDGATRAALARALLPAREDDRDALIAGLGDASPAVRTAAAGMLGRLADPRPVPEIAELLDGPLSAEALTLALQAARHGNLELGREYAARVLEETGPDDPLRVGALLGLPDDAGSMDLVAAAIGTSGPAARTAACDRLTATGVELHRCVEILRGIAAGESDPAAAIGAAEVLFGLGDPVAAAWLRALATNDDPGVRRRVMEISAARRFDAELIAAGLSDPDLPVAAAAAAAALRVPDPDRMCGLIPCS